MNSWEGGDVKHGRRELQAKMMVRYLSFPSPRQFCSRDCGEFISFAGLNALVLICSDSFQNTNNLSLRSFVKFGMFDRIFLATQFF